MTPGLQVGTKTTALSANRFDGCGEDAKYGLCIFLILIGKDLYFALFAQLQWCVFVHTLESAR
jgi:hypothetical protein